MSWNQSCNNCIWLYIYSKIYNDRYTTDTIFPDYNSQLTNELTFLTTGALSFLTWACTASVILATILFCAAVFNGSEEATRVRAFWKYSTAFLMLFWLKETAPSPSHTCHCVLLSPKRFIGLLLYTEKFPNKEKI